MNNFFYLKEYLPKRYYTDYQHKQDRAACYAFKDGILSENVKTGFISKIKEITRNSTISWIICFIPASTKQKTVLRFEKLANAIKEEGYAVEQNAIFNKYDKDSGFLIGKTGNPIDSFGFDSKKIANKNIILIDDIITRGTTFNLTAEKLKLLGANSVTGLFLAKTINPDYKSNYCRIADYKEPYYDLYEEERTYEKYNGSYAQDVQGWSDQDIDDVFDGDPEAYWSID